MSYDVVVAGGSFAGLVVATSVGGRVAIVEKGEVGEGQTSACATTLDVVEKLGLRASIEEVHEEGVIHTRTGVVRFALPYRFCTFDYRTFCRLLLERFDGDLVRSAATGVMDGAVTTGRGAVEGRTLVDATGWRAVLACSASPGFPAEAERTYGLEKPARGFIGSGLHFYLDPGVRADGYGWSFPAGDVSRAGVLSYIDAAGVRASTEAFLRREGMDGDHYHGGYLTAGLRPARAGGVFLVGDAAGHCLPLTGEGIRPAVFFAQRLAGLLEAERRGAMDRAAVEAAYDALQLSHARRYRWLRRLQRMLRGWPDPPLGAVLRAFAGGFAYRRLCDMYWNLAAPIETAPARAGAAPIEVSA